MCSRWNCSQFHKFEKVGARVEILCLNFQRTPPNKNIKSSQLATFEICEIFSNYYFSYVRDYKATLAWQAAINSRTNFFSQTSTQCKIKHMIFYRHFHIYLKKTLPAPKMFEVTVTLTEISLRCSVANKMIFFFCFWLYPKRSFFAQIDKFSNLFGRDHFYSYDELC